jgi:hypothetical protein
MDKFIKIIKMKRTWLVIAAIASVFGAPPQITNKVLSVISGVAEIATEIKVTEQ